MQQAKLEKFSMHSSKIRNIEVNNMNLIYQGT